MKLSDVTATPTIVPSVCSVPSRNFEILPFHHGTETYRIRVGDDLFAGKTQQEALSDAILTTFSQVGRFTLDIIT